jgi:hypothetical protein
VFAYHATERLNPSTQETPMSVESEKVIRTIEIVVVIGKHDKRKIEFHTDVVTGLEIKSRAGVPPENDLAIKRHDKLELITNDETVTIHDGEHFHVFPPGTIS